MNYDIALLIDVVTMVGCSALLLRFGNLSHSHPATIYLVFHVATFTLRLFSLWNGALPMWSTTSNYEGIREEELTRAMSLADVALISMTIAWLLAAKRTAPAPQAQVGRPLNRKIVFSVIAIALPLGLWGSLAQMRVGGEVLRAVGTDGQPESGYFQILPVWPGLVILVLIYLYGFRWWLMLPMSAQILLVAMQGYHRFRAVIPIILMVQMLLDRRGKRWPTPAMAAALVAMALVFYPLKSIGRMTQEGASVSEIASHSGETMSNAVVGRTDDQMLLDEFACALTLMDQAGKLYWGQPYLALVTLPIPRTFWPEKPTVADYITDFSRPWRPMRENGMIVTFLGEAYANFGYIGLGSIPFLLAFILARAHQRLLAQPYGTLGHFAYLLVACNLIQVFRDGLTSIVFFVFVHMMPLAAIVLIQLGWEWFSRPPGRRKPVHSQVPLTRPVRLPTPRTVR